jgi:hypothetical protein
MAEQTVKEPLPIWFFVGLILSVFGAIVLVSGLIPGSRPTVLSELRPNLYWGAIMLVCGSIFLALGWRGHKHSG